MRSTGFEGPEKGQLQRPFAASGELAETAVPPAAPPLSGAETPFAQDPSASPLAPAHAPRLNALAEETDLTISPGQAGQTLKFLDPQLQNIIGSNLSLLQQNTDALFSIAQTATAKVSLLCPENRVTLGNPSPETVGTLLTDLWKCDQELDRLVNETTAIITHSRTTILPALERELLHRTG